MSHVLSRDSLEVALARTPSIRSVIERLARKAVAGKRLPGAFTAGTMDYTAQRELEGLLGIRCERLVDGRVHGTLPPPLREPSGWLSAIAVLGLHAEETFRRDEFFVRKGWSSPRQLTEPLRLLAAHPTVAAFVRSEASAATWARLFDKVVEFAADDGTPSTTLSQLGSDWFNDSKCLRSGALRDQLVTILGVLGDVQPLPAREILSHFGIVDNPYTTHVTVFAPFTFTLADGSVCEFPETLFRKGLAVQLPLETIERIASIDWRADELCIATSENAAPFARMVAEGQIALYTEGYPNSAVKGLLAKMASAKVVAVHEGDADLDGFRIAAEVAKTIPVRRVVAVEVVAEARGRTGIAMDESQRKRLHAAIVREPLFRFVSSLKALEALGCWYEQEAFHEEKN